MNAIEKLFIYFNSFVYSWLIGIFILWFLLARKDKSLLKPAIFCFLMSALFSVGAGFLNSFSGNFLNWNLNHNSFIYYFLVGLSEETIKFLALIIGMFLATKKEFAQIYKKNWLAYCCASALSFSAAENFIYGISGTGGIARLIPMFAHSSFALFFGMGLYKCFQTERLSFSKYFHLFIGWFASVFFHAFYDCVVSDQTPLEVNMRVLLGCLGALFAVINFWLLSRNAFEVKNSFPETITSPSSKIISERKEEKILIPKHWYIFSVFFPGSGHLFCLKEIFNGLSFLLLSLFIPYLILNFSSLFFISKTKDIIQFFILMIFICACIYSLIGFWSSWELAQRNHDLDNTDNKKRLTAFFPISILFFSMMIFSFLLPIDQSKKGKPKSDDKKIVVKEIPLGLDLQIEKIVEIPNGIEIEKNDGIEKLSEPVNSEKNKNKGLPQSQNKKINAFQSPPKIGYIGVQLAQEVLPNGLIQTYINKVYEGTSAERAGFQNGDVLLEVNGKSVIGMNPIEVSSSVKGKLGTSVSIKVFRYPKEEITLTAQRTGTIFTNE